MEPRILRGITRSLAVCLMTWAAVVLPVISSGVASAGTLFPDAQLEEAVRAQVFAKRQSREPLVEADVVNVSTVDARHRGIRSLAGLEKCRNLAMIELGGNQIVDLTPLSGLARLQYLDIQSNRVETLEPLRGVPALQYLHAAQNRIVLLGPLTALTNLAALYLGGNRVEDLQPLLALPRLSSLYLERNRIRRLDGIGQLRSLSSLSLAGNRISELSPLQGLDRLQYLFLESNRIQDLQPLIRWVSADQEQRFAPFLNLYLGGNPLSSVARRSQWDALAKTGVRVHR